MKRNFIMTRLLGSLRQLALGTALLLLGSPAINSQAQNSPVGQTWDCVISGPREGIAYINFFSDSTFTGYEVLVPKASKNKSSSSSNSRDNTGGRDDSGGSSTNTPGQQISGFLPFEGNWGYDIKGKIIGSFIEVSALENCVTNSIAVATNSDGIFGLDGEYAVGPDANGDTIWYVNEIKCSALTNAISFTGKVVPGKRLTLVCSTSFGKVNYRGVPATAQPPLGGSWYGTRQQDNQSYVEFLTVYDSIAYSGNPNTYDVIGSGPGYTYFGHILVSAQKKFAMAAGIDPDAETIRAVIGPFNSKSISSKTHGWQQPSGAFKNKLLFDTVLQPVPAP